MRQFLTAGECRVLAFAEKIIENGGLPVAGTIAAMVDRDVISVRRSIRKIKAKGRWPCDGPQWTPAPGPSDGLSDVERLIVKAAKELGDSGILPGPYGIGIKLRMATSAVMKHVADMRARGIEPYAKRAPRPVKEPVKEQPVEASEALKTFRLSMSIPMPKAAIVDDDVPGHEPRTSNREIAMRLAAARRLKAERCGLEITDSDLETALASRR